MTEYRRFLDIDRGFACVNESLKEHVCWALRLAMPDLRDRGSNYSAGQKQLASAVDVLKLSADGLQVMDYAVRHSTGVKTSGLDELLLRSNFGWTVCSRCGKPGQVRGMPLGVEAGAYAVKDRPRRPGVRLASAWENLHGLHADTSEAYRHALLAVEVPRCL